MIAIFNTKLAAQKFSDKCHASLIAQCPGYKAALWQIPMEFKEGWGIQVPQEYYKQLYPTAMEIKKATKVEFDAKKELVEKPELTDKNKKILNLIWLG